MNLDGDIDAPEPLLVTLAIPVGLVDRVLRAARLDAERDAIVIVDDRWQALRGGFRQELAEQRLELDLDDLRALAG